MNRYALILEYDGSFFSGWQWQKDAPSVQTALEKALFSLTGEPITVYAAGRTDSGVHALGQVVHMDLSRVWTLDTLRRGLNFYLKDIPIKIIKAYETPYPFHARFSALSRQYQYMILNRSSASALIEKRAWWIPVPLNRAAMIEGCTHLQGHHDFSYFRHRDCQSASPWKTLDSLTLEDRGEILIIHAKGRSFLHRQVRIMVGALVALGRERWDCSHLIRLLNPVASSLDRPQACAVGSLNGNMEDSSARLKMRENVALAGSIGGALGGDTADTDASVGGLETGVKDRAGVRERMGSRDRMHHSDIAGASAGGWGRENTHASVERGTSLAETLLGPLTGEGPNPLRKPEQESLDVEFGTGLDTELVASRGNSGEPALAVVSSAEKPQRATTAPAHGLYLTHVDYGPDWPF